MREDRGNGGTCMTPDLYRQHAAECLQLSIKITDPHSCAVLRAMAIAWADLAVRREAADNELLHHAQPGESPN